VCATLLFRIRDTGRDGTGREGTETEELASSFVKDKFASDVVRHFFDDNGGTRTTTVSVGDSTCAALTHCHWEVCFACWVKRPAPADGRPLFSDPRLSQPFFLMKTSGTALLTARNGSSGRALRVTVLFYRRPDVWRPSVNHTTRVGVLTVGRQQYDDQVLLDDDIFYGACQHRAGRLCELYQQIISFSPINLDARTDAFFYGAVRPTTPALLAASE
jgi:hypothetical protein